MQLAPVPLLPCISLEPGEVPSPAVHVKSDHLSRRIVRSPSAVPCRIHNVLHPAHIVQPCHGGDQPSLDGVASLSVSPIGYLYVPPLVNLIVRCCWLTHWRAETIIRQVQVEPEIPPQQTLGESSG